MANSKASRRNSMKNLQEIKIALLDTSLFLDTHADDQQAIEYFQTVSQQYTDALTQYESDFGPITKKSQEVISGDWQWVKTPWPWEKEV